MKITHLAIGAALAAMVAGAAGADPAYGTYRTIPDDNGNFGHIEVSACGSKICGKLVKSFDGSGKEIASDNTGKNIIWDMEANGDGTYGNGKVWDPSRDKTYNSKMELKGENLAISGCVLFVCRDGGTWMRIN